jgi:hypothetical protein
MMKRLLNSALSGVVFALAVLATAALAVTLTGRESSQSRAIYQAGMFAVTPEAGITATPSGTITTAFQLGAGVSQVTTVATIGDAVKLPSMAPGAPTSLDGSLNVVIINNTANSMNVFPFAATDVIVNTTAGTAGGAGAAIAVAALKMADCWSIAGSGRWYCSIG